MKGIVEERAAMLGEYIIESKATVRSTAKKFGVSKSTVHKRKAHKRRSCNKKEISAKESLRKRKKLKINCNTAHTPYKTEFSEYILGILELYFL